MPVVAELFTTRMFFGAFRDGGDPALFAGEPLFAGGLLLFDIRPLGDNVVRSN